MSNKKGFSLIGLLLGLAVLTVFSLAVVYVVKKNPKAFFPATQTQQVAGETEGATSQENREKSGVEKFFNLIDQKIKSIITPNPPIGNLTPVRDLRGTWVSSLSGKGIQSFGKFNTGPGVTQIYQEGDIKLVIESVSGNVASGTFQYINLCTWGKMTAPKIPPISVPKHCVSPGPGPIQIRVSGTRLDFGTVSAGGVNATMQANYTTDLISGSTTTTVSPYGIIKGEIHLIRAK